MPLPPSPKCLVCESSLPIRRVWSRYAYRGLRLLKPTGVRCPGCGARFVILQRGAIIASMTSLLVFGGVVFAAVYCIHSLEWNLSNTAELVILLLAVPPFLMLQNRVAARFCRLRRVEQGEAIRFPLEEGRASGI